MLTLLKKPITEAKNYTRSVPCWFQFAAMEAVTRTKEKTAPHVLRIVGNVRYRHTRLPSSSSSSVSSLSPESSLSLQVYFKEIDIFFLMCVIIATFSKWFSFTSIKTTLIVFYRNLYRFGFFIKCKLTSLTQSQLLRTLVNNKFKLNLFI